MSNAYSRLRMEYRLFRRLLRELRRALVRTWENEAPHLPDTAEQRYESVRRMVKRRKAICIMDQAPDPEKVFAMISGTVSRNFRPPNLKSISFGWQETTYSESYYEREGAA